jgi:uncharacterized membrane protein YoaK (UPF0700 family)
MGQLPRAADRSRRAFERRDALIVALAMVSGSADAISFVSLGHVFTSVMTGNLILAGVGIATGDGTLFLHAALALGAFAAGALVGARLAGLPTEHDPPWPRRVSVALGAEVVLLVAFTVVWELGRGHPGTSSRAVLLGLLAAALGLQSAAILRLGVAGLSTTYLTGTLTTAIQALAHGAAWRANARSLAILAAALGGAAAGAGGARTASWLAPLIPLVLGGGVWSAGPRLGARLEREAR